MVNNKWQVNKLLINSLNGGENKNPAFLLKSKMFLYF